MKYKQIALSDLVACGGGDGTSPDAASATDYSSGCVDNSRQTSGGTPYFKKVKVALSLRLAAGPTQVANLTLAYGTYCDAACASTATIWPRARLNTIR